MTESPRRPADDAHNKPTQDAPRPDTKLPEASVDTTAKVNQGGDHRLPHERDESPEGLDPQPRSVGKQAASDIERGLVDTDLHNIPGVEKVKADQPSSNQAQPQPGSKRD
jgi:hypothetical protein